MKKIISVLMSLCFSICFIFCVACSSNKKGTLDDGVLTIGYTIYAPMNYFDDNGDFVGFDTELAKAVGKELGVEVEFVEINWDNKVLALNTYEIDAVWNGMTITNELKEAMSITDAYLENKQVIVCQKAAENKFTSKESLSQASEVLVEAGSAGESAVIGVGVSPKTMDAQKDTLLEVKTDINKIAVIDKTMAEVLVGDGTSYSDLTFIDVGFENEQFGIGFRKSDTDTKDKVNDAIKSLRESGFVDELMKKYFG